MDTKAIIARKPNVEYCLLMEYCNNEETIIFFRHCGLCKSSRDVHRKKKKIFMNWLKNRHSKLELSNLNNVDILDFQLDVENNFSSISFKESLTSCLRSSYVF